MRECIINIQNAGSAAKQTDVGQSDPNTNSRESDGFGVKTSLTRKSSRQSLQTVNLEQVESLNFKF